MKFDDAINGALAIGLGVAIIIGSRGMPQIQHIAYGPGFFPTLAGTGLVLAGAVLILRRVLAGGGAVAGLIRLRGDGRRGAFGFALIVGVILLYILLVDGLGFLVLTPFLLFALILWFERRVGMALVGAVIGTLVLHTFFYQLMSAPLPWGLLEPWSGVLTW